MKKRLEAELISIAHRILKLKNKSEVDQLYKETQKLYETLTVLKFYQDNFEWVKSEVSEDVLEEKLTKVEEAETPVEEVLQAKETIIEPVATIEHEEEVEEEVLISVESDEIPETAFDELETEEEIEINSEPEVEEEHSFEPIFELEEDEEDEEPIEPAETASELRPETNQVALEDLLGENYVDPVFVKPNEVTLFPSESIDSEQEKQTMPEEPGEEGVKDISSKSIAIGLNDRIGFVQHLFNDSNEDFNRVISQLNTFDTFEEAKDFINEMVIPDYNYWVGEEEYIERFMEIVEKKFR